MNNHVFEVENATEHELFLIIRSGNPNIRFYAGAPLLNKMDLSWDLFALLIQNPIN
jgi:hypothetical protein